MLVVISPAKALDCSPSKIRKHTQPQFLKESRELVKVLKQKPAREIKQLMGVSESIAKLNYDRFQAWKTPFTSNNAKQAIFTFKGDVYKSFDVESLSPDDLEFAQKHLYILSGLYGLLRVFDLIQPYRLEMGTKLSFGQWKDLYQFWGDKLNKQLNKAIKQSKSSVLVNLASNEYYQAIHPNQIAAPVVTPVFKERRDKDYKVIGFIAKKARGLMSRYIIQNRIKQVDDLQAFKESGYRYRPKMSDESTWIFTRSV